MIADCCDDWAESINCTRLIRLHLLECPHTLKRDSLEAHLETLQRAQMACGFVAMSWPAANDEGRVAA